MRLHSVLAHYFLFVLFSLPIQHLFVKGDSLDNSASGDYERTIYDPADSNTYKKRWIEYVYYPQETVDYVSAGITGYVSQDLATVDNSGAMIDFLCVGEEDEYEILPFDGVLGMGPDSAVVSDIIPQKTFGIFLNPEGGELQLGGYIRSSTYNGFPVNFIKTVKGNQDGYQVTVDYVRIETSNGTSHTVYNNPSRPTKRANTQNENQPTASLGDEAAYSMQTVVDSGTQKIMLPTNVSSLQGNKTVTISLYQEVYNFIASNSDITQPVNFFLYFSVSGVEYESIVNIFIISYLTGDFSQTLILGQVFFWYNLVVHNVSDPNQPLIGFATKNPHYVPNDNVDGSVTTMPIYYMENYYAKYYLEITIGTPGTIMKVLVDTGSDDLLVASAPHFSIPWWGWVIIGGACLVLFATALAHKPYTPSTCVCCC